MRIALLFFVQFDDGIILDDKCQTDIITQSLRPKDDLICFCQVGIRIVHLVGHVGLLGQDLGETGAFLELQILDLVVVGIHAGVWYMKEDYAKQAKWTLFDLQDKLKQSGWMVPAYTMPKNIEDSVVMRIVVRQGFSRDMADMLLGDIRNAIADFERLDYPTPSRMAQEKNLPAKPTLFTHTGKKG